MLGVAGGLPFAYVVGIVSYLLAPAESPLSSVWIALPVTAVGIVTGVVVGIAQSLVLPWSKDARGRWLVRSVYGWGIGAALGTVIALLVELLRLGGRVTFALNADTLLMVVMTPVLGLVLGLAL